MLYHPDLSDNEKKEVVAKYSNRDELYRVLLSDDVILTYVKGVYVPIKNEGTVKCVYTKDVVYEIPLVVQKDIAVEVEGVLYHKRSPLIVKALDTENHIIKEKAYKGTKGFYETTEKLTYIDRKDAWFETESLREAEDTGLLYHKNELNKKNGKYYRYTRMAHPYEAWGRAPYVNETIFPKDIKERRLGIEYEFGETYQMFAPFLKSEHVFNWESVRDGSLDAIPQGIEFVSIPFKLDELHKAGEFLDFSKKHGAEIFPSCGFHVHVGAQDMSFLDISRLVTLATSIEEEMFILGGVDRKKNTYCKSLDEKFTGFSDIILPKDKNKCGRKLYSGQNAEFESRHKQSKYVDARNHTGIRYYWFNIDRFFYKREQPQQKTVEFRNHMGTFDTQRFVNFALLCYYIVEFAMNHSKDTCRNTKLMDIVKTSQLRHRKQLIRYLKEYLEI